jgi:tetratricopeptide (TPR) repeat protein
MFSGDAVKAEKQYQQIIGVYPKNPLGHYKLGALKTRQKNYEQAVKAFDRALAIDPGRMDVFTAQIRTLMAMGKTKRAIARCRQRLKESPDNAFLHNMLGEIYLNQKAYSKAAKAFNRTIDLAPNLIQPYRNLARTYTVQGKTGEAIQQIEERLRANPGAIRLAFLMGLLCEANNDTEKAITYYRQVMEKAPDFIPAVNNLAFLIAEGGGTEKEMDEALKLALKAVERLPDQPQIVDTLGWVYYRRGEIEKAYGQFERLLEKGADDPVFHYHLGMVLYKQGRKVKARECLQKALEKPSRHVDKKAIEEMLKELG